MTPLFDVLRDYAARRPARFHMPGHKGGPLPIPALSPAASLDGLAELGGQLRLPLVRPVLRVLDQLGQHRLVQITQGHQGVALPSGLRRQGRAGPQAHSGEAEGPRSDLPAVSFFHFQHSFGPRPFIVM